jgi:dolichol-phosphate mannosyltransferase
MFYRFMSAIIHSDLPPDTGDFRLMSRRCLDAVRSMRETHRFLRGMVAWVGFPQIAVQFDRPARAAGTTKYNMRKMMRFAWTAAISFSAAPLRISLAMGVVVGLFGVGVLFWALYVHYVGHTIQGWTSLIAVISIVGGAILWSIGILGEYIGRIFEELKGRPLYVISTRANLPEPQSPNPEQQSVEARIEVTTHTQSRQRQNV